jgi:hypothetical protein
LFVRALYQGEAAITRRDGTQVPADVTIWLDDGGVQSSWGGRAVVRSPDSLISDVGLTCMIRWPVPGGGFVAGEVVLSAVQSGAEAETYRLVGGGDLREIPGGI